MTIRITQGMTSAEVLANIESISATLSQTQTVLSSGERINSPSDDPYGTAQSLQLSASLAQTKQFEANVQQAQSWLNVTDTALGNVSSLVQRARDLVVEAGNGAMSPSDLQDTAAELKQIIDSVKTEANAQYAGRYVFSGTAATSTAPYSLSDATDTYQGDSGSIVREIGPGVSLQINSIGLSVFGGTDPSSPGTETGILGALRTAYADMTASPPNTTALQSTDLTNIDNADNTLLNERAVVGARSDQLTTASNRLSQVEEVTTQQLSNTKDADMAKTMIDLSQEQAVYQAALRAGAMLLQPSLMDFLATG